MRAVGLLMIGTLLGGGGPALAQKAVSSVTAPKLAETPLARPLVGPVESWVVPVTAPPPPAASDGASTINLLADVQNHFTANGDAGYFASVFKISSAQGLDAGSLQISWDPALETLTLHRFRLIRDGKTIDLLGDGSKLTIVRREPNLDSATLDGRLTATMQPEDLRVGDIVDQAWTKVRRDPAMAGRSEELTGPNDGTRYGRFHVRMVWPTSKAMAWRTYPGILKPTVSRTAAGNELIADLTDATPPRAPQGAPTRFSVVNAVEISDFPDWASVSRTVQPLYASATTLAPNSPLRAEIARIAARSSDPKVRAGLALQLVEDQIRYLFLGMDGGGYVPASADTTWTRRYGDCKAKTVLLVALLRELGIDARPVLVSTGFGDLLKVRLPMMGAFDHAIVEARIGGRSYWLDGTRLGDTSLDRLVTPSYHVGLPIVAGGTGLTPLIPAQLTTPTETTSLALDARGGIDVPAPATGEMRFRGENATDMRVKYAAFVSSERQTEMRKLWRKTYDFVTPDTVDSHSDEATGDFIMTMAGSAKMDWFTDNDARWYELDRARLGWKFDMVRDGAIEKDAPFAFDYPDYWESRETIRLPQGGRGFKLQGESTDQTVGGLYAFHRKIGIDGDTLSVEVSTRALADELPASKAEQAHDTMASLGSKGVYVRVPDDYLATDGDLAAHPDDKAATAKALMKRGAVRFDRREVEAALADEDRALALDPSLASAHAVRALALAAKADPASEAEADRAIALDPKQTLAWRAKGGMALTKRRFADAEKDFDAVLAIEPKNAFALFGRGAARASLGRGAEALADIDASAAIDDTLPIAAIRSVALQQVGRQDEAFVEANRAVSANPRDLSARLVRASLLVSRGNSEQAIADLDAAIANQPTADLFVERASLRGKDKEKRDADIAAALRLDPKSVGGLTMRAAAAIEDGTYARVEGDLDAIEKIDPASPVPNSLRMQMFEKQGRFADALRLANLAVAKHPASAMSLNSRCWLKATRNIELATALADCDAALKIAPKSPAALDSRAFTHLRLGAVDEAITDYNAALAASPTMAASLFGRAIAYARKGDHARALADLAAARKSAPEIETRFAEYGMRLPADLAGTTPVAALTH